MVDKGCVIRQWYLIHVKALWNPKYFLIFGHFGFNASHQGTMDLLPPRLSEPGREKWLCSILDCQSLGGSFG